MNEKTMTELQELEVRFNTSVGDLSERLSTLDRTVTAHARKSDQREQRRQDRDEAQDGMFRTFGASLAKLVARDEERDVEEGRLLTRFATDRNQINERLDLQDHNDITQNTKLSKIQATVDEVSGGQTLVVKAAQLVVEEAEARKTAVKIRETSEKERDRLLRNLDTGFKLLVSLAALALVAWAVFTFAVHQVERPASITISAPATK